MEIQLGTLVVLVAVALSGCGGGSKNEQAAVAPEPTFQELLKTDFAALNALDASVLDRFDRANNRIFSKIFGGTDAPAVKQFLDTRIRYFLSQQEAETAFDVSVSAFGEKANTIGGAVVGASNIGASAWFTGVVRGVPLQFTYAGKTIPVESSRVGVMQFGPGYANSFKTNDGQVIPFPSAYRQSILVHEARHSDCTGGLTDADITVARTSRSADEFDRDFMARACMHMHVRCPKGHEYEGLYACDQEGWGAYTVGAVYAAATLNMEPEGSISWQVMKFAVMDSLSRTLVTRTGDPDMSSTGVRTAPTTTTPAQTPVPPPAPVPEPLPVAPVMPPMPEMPEMPAFPSV